MKIFILFMIFFNFILCGSSISFAEEPLDFSSPEELLQSYLRACNALDFSLSDQCYTKEFQEYIRANKEYMAHRNVNQLRNAYGYWSNRPYDIEVYGNKAIIRFSPEFVRPEPFYMVNEDGKWKIDGVFSIKNVKIQDSRTWFWKNPNIDNEKQWLKQ
ncbi:MAG: hypothetical protein ABII88_06770 [Candidatus Omnitrophota bacterium]